jgi:hypothetical protein
MTSAQLNRMLTDAIRHKEQERLGDLYEALASLIYCDDRVSSVIDGVDKCRLAKLVQTYGRENVKWMLKVLKEDIEDGREQR